MDLSRFLPPSLSFLLPLSPPSHPSFSMKKPFCRLAGLIDSVWFHKLDSISEHLSDSDLSEASFQCRYPSDPVMCARLSNGRRKDLYMYLWIGISGVLVQWPALQLELGKQKEWVGGKPWFLMFDKFCGVSTSTMANFKVIFSRYISVRPYKML